MHRILYFCNTGAQVGFTVKESCETLKIMKGEE